MANNYSEEEKFLIEKYHSEGLNNSEISRKLERPNAGISRYIRRIGLSPNNNRHLQIVGDEGTCRSCLQSKKLSSFQYISGPSVKYPAYSSHCRECMRVRQYEKLNTDIESYFKRLYSGIKSRASDKGLPFDLTKGILYSLWIEQGGRCWYTQTPMTCVRGEGIRANSTSVDRLVPKLGYIDSNIVLCTRRFNTVKQDLSLEEMEIVFHPFIFEKIKNKIKNI